MVLCLIYIIVLELALSRECVCDLSVMYYRDIYIYSDIVVCLGTIDFIIYIPAAAVCAKLVIHSVILIYHACSGVYMTTSVTSLCSYAPPSTLFELYVLYAEALLCSAIFSHRPSMKISITQSLGSLAWMCDSPSITCVVLSRLLTSN